MMSSISEAWNIMSKHMGMRYDDIGKVFEKWSSEGELVCLLHLSSIICSL
jgi:6-phosphogluconate dehydrogenase